MNGTEVFARHEGAPLPRILCVDDEPNVLSGLERTLYEEFEVSTASSGAEALEQIEAEDEAFDVIMSDMRMPQMSGAQFLARARVVSPDSVRVLLTGQSELDAAIAAVNDGGIFRFLMKPCPHDSLKRALNDAVAQARMRRAERDLLENTLMNAIGVVTEVLAIASPLSSDRSDRLRSYVAHASKTLGWEERWRFELAAMLSQLGCVTVPNETLARAYAAQPLSDEEERMLAAHPRLAAGLIARIPRLAEVSAMVGAQNNPGSVEDPVVQRGAALIRAACVLDAHVRGGCALRTALVEMSRTREHSPEILQALATYRPEERTDVVRGVEVSDLRVGMVLEEDVLAVNGAVLLRAGAVMSDVVVARLVNFSRGLGVAVPIRVRIPAN